MKDIEALDTEDRLKVMARIYLLKDNPYPEGSKKLEAKDNLWRGRVGDYRKYTRSRRKCFWYLLYVLEIGKTYTRIYEITDLILLI